MPDMFKPPAQAKAQATALKKTTNGKIPLSTSGSKVVTPAKTRLSTRANFRFMDYIWISLMWVGITYLWGGINGVILPKLNEKFVTDENYKGTLLGVITALGMVVAIVVQPAAGALSDINHSAWGRRRPYILVGGIMVVITLIVMATMVVYLASWWVLLVFYLLLQLFDNIVQGAYQGIIPDCVPPNRRGKASGAMGIVQIIGNVTGLAVATYFIDEKKPQYALIIIALVFSAMLIPTLFTIREEPLKNDHIPRNGFKVVIGTIGELRQHPDFVKFIASRFLVLTALATLTLFGLYYLQDVMGQGEGTLTQSYTLLGVVIIGFSVASIMPAVWLSERVGRKRVVIVSCIVGAIGMLLLSTATNMTQVIMYGSLLGVATGSFNSLDWALATDLLPPEAAGRFMGISNLAGAGSQALAALLGGGLRDGFNAIGVTYFNLPHLGYSALFVMSTFFFILGIFFLRSINDPQKYKG